jgi:hypothetical protein
MRAFFSPQTGKTYGAVTFHEQPLQTLKARWEVRLNARKEKGQESKEEVTP